MLKVSSRGIGAIGIGIIAVGVLACGSDGGSSDGDGDTTTSSTTGLIGGVDAGGASATNGSGSGGTTGIGVGGGWIDPSVTATTGTGGTMITPEPPTGCAPSADDSGCVGVAFEGETIPLDIYVMFDLSCSMSCSVERSGCCRNSDDPDPLDQWRIQPVREAMKSFLQDPMSAGIGVGLGFFGDHDLSQREDSVVCSVDGHADAVVDIQTLPGSAATLIGELEAGEPQGGTPTHLAIDGACSYVGSWKGQNPGRKVVVLLVTDGIPEYSCQADIQKARQAAADCYRDGDGFETYVLGVVANNNNSLDQLNGIAEAGGTEHAYLTNTADVAGSVLEALNAIRADAVIPCDMQIPPPPAGETLNPGKVNLGVCDPSGEVVVTPYVESADKCSGSPGWYYNDPSSPETIHLCDVTCDTVSVPGSSLFFSVGCDTQVFDPVK